jgi:hypothetical protein
VEHDASFHHIDANQLGGVRGIAAQQVLAVCAVHGAGLAVAYSRASGKGRRLVR